MLPGIYLDEDTQSDALIAALRARDVAVTTTSEAGLGESTDAEQLRFSTSRNLVLATCNIADFARLHSECLAPGIGHSGIILIEQQKWGPGELARRIIRLLVDAPEGMRNRFEYISHW